MSSHPLPTRLLLALACLWAFQAHAQSFRVQCPTHTALHPLMPDGSPNPHIKCQQLSGGDGFATMADGTQTYMFSFGPLSGLGNIVHGLPGTVTSDEFNQSNIDAQGNVLEAVKIGAPDSPDYAFNGAIGLAPDFNADAEHLRSISIALDSANHPIAGKNYKVNDPLVIAGGGGSGATGFVDTVDATGGIVSVTIVTSGQSYTSLPTVTVTSAAGTGAQLTAKIDGPIDGHIDPRLAMDVGVMNGNIPAPMIAIDEGDELFLTLTNVGMVMRPDLFEQHTVHFHGYPNASAFYDGVPDASVAINIGGSFTYYYLAPEAGTYMWHCHISPPEHLQMGMVGQLYVRPRQNSVAPSGSLYAAAQAAQLPAAVDTKCGTNDLLCSTQLPPADTGATRKAGQQYAFNDGDGTTTYDVEYPIQMHGFDPNFHFVGMTFNPESFVDTKDKFFLLNGRSYPDTVNPAPMNTQSTDGTPHFSQPLSSLINIPVGGRALLRFSDLNVTEYHTLSSLGIPMHVVGFNARLLRDQDGVNTDYYANSITLAGGETADVILDASDTSAYPAGSVFYLYTPQLDHLANDAENFGGMMTEVHVLSCTADGFDPLTKQCISNSTVAASK